MRRIVPYLLLFALFYGVWYYFQNRPAPPLDAHLFPYAATDVAEIEIFRRGKTLRLRRQSDADWVAENDQRSIPDRKAASQRLLAAILSCRGRAVSTRRPAGPPRLEMELRGNGLRDRIRFFAPADSLPATSHLLSLNGGEDYFLVHDLPLRRLPLRFADFRDSVLIDLRALPRLDSLTWWSATDSSRTHILSAGPGLDSLTQHYRPRLGTFFADAFGEVHHARHLLGHYHFHGGGDSVALRVFHHDRWARPYVLRGNGTEYFAADAPGLPLPDSTQQQIEQQTARQPDQAY